MNSAAFVADLESFQADKLAPLVDAGRIGTVGDDAGDAIRLLQVALANEINVTDLAARWIPTTEEVDVKLAFARQAGDESSHFRLVADRLAALGFDASAFVSPPENPLFAYMRALPSTVERVAAGLFTLEAIAYGVNETFMAHCAARGDLETVRIYRDYIQPDERAHREMGRALLIKYALTAEQQSAARATVARVLELATAGRAAAASKLGVACLPGC